MREGFDAAGFPGRAADKTAESGVMHTVPTRNGTVDGRTMEGSGHQPRRAVFTREGTNDPVRMDRRQSLMELRRQIGELVVTWIRRHE